MFRKALLAVSMLAATVPPSFAAGDQIRQLTLLSRPQAAQPQEFQMTQLLAQEWRKLGLDIKVQNMPFEQMTDLVWYQRDKWDMTAWQMVGRPERSDPDELIYNLFHSSTAKNGYNFDGYINPAYDEVAAAQRVATDPKARQALVFKAQEIVANDQPILNMVHPRLLFAYNQSVWDPASIVEQSGIGIRNFWTMIGAKPLGAKTDILLNSADNVNAINPLYVSGSVDSWITELLWDRLVRVGPDGLPKPWAAQSFTWVDDKTIDVTLRSDLKWHDGTPVTVDDVIFSFQAPQGTAAPMYKPFVGAIDSVEKTGDLSVRFHLKTASAPFVVATLAKVNLIPKKFWEGKLAELTGKNQTAESFQEEKPMGSGPYRFVRWLKNEEVLLEANPDHFSAPKAKRWVLRIIPNTEAAVGMLKTGELNFLSEYPGDPKVLQALADSDKNIKIVETTELGFRYIGVNIRRPPFDDVAFRRALSAAIDRRLIVNAAFRGNAVPANSTIAPVIQFWHDPAVDSMKTGTDVAKQMLQQAGYTVVDGHLHYPEGKKEIAP